ncbi:MAG: TerB N-terminal domain-containing protein, partial [Victivallales bacterium]|nr:TerB N-terminal domain-containing protein [Victivallales bacterium]
MNIYDLITYVQNRFRVKVRFKWTDGTAISILRHPYTGQWVAALMRQWNDDLGQWIERCDLKCGRDCLREPVPPYLSLPFLVTDEHWAGVELGPGADRSVVLRLVEQAFANGSRAHGCEIVLDSQVTSRQEASQDTPIDYSLATDDADDDIPEKIRQMQRLFEYGSGSPEQGRNQNFYRQGKFMEDYEDDASWAGHLIRYFPTYHSLNVP